MDLETPYDAREASLLKPLKLNVPGTRTVTDVPRRSQQQQQQHKTIDQEAARHGMPWTKSIDPTYEEKRIHRDSTSSSPFYMSFWQWQLEFMKKHLTNLRVVPCKSKDGRAYIDGGQHHSNSVLR